MNIEQVNVTGADGSTVETGHFTSSYDTYLQFTNLPIETSRQYTLHGYIKASKAGTITCLDNKANITTSWQEIKMVITPTSKTFVMYFYYPAEFWIYNWKLEIGDVASYWTPSPLDAKYDLKQAWSIWEQTADGFRADIGTKLNQTQVQNFIDVTANGLSAEISKKTTPAEVDNKISSAESKITEDYTTKIKESADGLTVEINKKTSSSDVTTLINANADSIRLKTGKLAWSATNSSMDENGNLKCTNGDFTGKVNATSGTFKGEVSASKFTTTDCVVNSSKGNYTINKFDHLVILNGWGVNLTAFAISNFILPDSTTYPTEQVGFPCIIGVSGKSYTIGTITFGVNGGIEIYYYATYGANATVINKNNYTNHNDKTLYFSGSWFAK